jgi:hypothetical protein
LHLTHGITNVPKRAPSLGFDLGFAFVAATTALLVVLAEILAMH